jgi:hypothetical protein
MKMIAMMKIIKLHNNNQTWSSQRTTQQRFFKKLQKVKHKNNDKKVTKV